MTIKTKLDRDKELDGCSYEKVEEYTFLDHKGEGAIAAARRFRSLGAARNYIEENNKDAIVYVYDLQEYNLEHSGIWYYLRCAIRKK